MKDLGQAIVSGLWVFCIVLFLGAIFEDRSSADTGTVPAELPDCLYEDGNTDGLPCLWIDPDTGKGYYVDSSNYRD